MSQDAAEVGVGPPVVPLEQFIRCQNTMHALVQEREGVMAAFCALVDSLRPLVEKHRLRLQSDAFDRAWMVALDYTAKWRHREAAMTQVLDHLTKMPHG